MSDATPLHPGTITYLDGDQVVATRDAAAVPEAMRFAATPEGLVPVVRVVASRRGDQRIIREYGPEGQLLRSTVQVSR